MIHRASVFKNITHKLKYLPVFVSSLWFRIASPHVEPGTQKSHTVSKWWWMCVSKPEVPFPALTLNMQSTLQGCPWHWDMGSIFQDCLGMSGAKAQIPSSQRGLLPWVYCGDTITLCLHMECTVAKPWFGWGWHCVDTALTVKNHWSKSVPFKQPLVPRPAQYNPVIQHQHLKMEARCWREG